MIKQYEFVQIPGGAIAAKANYAFPGIEDYVGNPLIEALPYIHPDDELVDLMSVYPALDKIDKERLLDESIRSVIVEQRLFKLRQPWSKHFELERNITAAIRTGYEARNPFAAENAVRLNNGYKAIQTGNYSAINGGIETTSSGFSIIGVSGTGKTKTVELALNTYPQVIVHTNYDGRNLSLYQVVWLHIDIPSHCTPLGLCYLFFQKLSRLVGKNYYNEVKRYKLSQDQMLAEMQQLALTHALGVLVINEVQFLHGKNKTDVMNFLVNLVNEVGVPVVLVGNLASYPILAVDFKQARRATGHSGLLEWERLENKTDEGNKFWRLLLGAMWRYQWTRNYAPLTEEIIDLMYEETQGIVDLVIKLFVLVQRRAMATGDEIITANMIHSVAAEKFALCGKMLSALRSGKKSDIAKCDGDFKLQIATILKDYDEGFQPEDNISTAQQYKKEDCNPEKEALINDIIQKLLNEIKADQDHARYAAEVVVNTLWPNVDATLALREAIKIVFNKEGKIKVSTKKNKTKDKKVIIRDDKDDLCNILDEAKLNSMSFYDNLQAHKYCQDPLIILGIL